MDVLKHNFIFMIFLATFSKTTMILNAKSPQSKCKFYCRNLIQVTVFMSLKSRYARLCDELQVTKSKPRGFHSILKSLIQLLYDIHKLMLNLWRRFMKHRIYITIFLNYSFLLLNIIGQYVISYICTLLLQFISADTFNFETNHPLKKGKP